MEKTPFSGITRLDPSESIVEDGGAFTGRDRGIIDFFLERGAKTHRHTGLPGIENPDVGMEADIITSGGTIPGDLSFVIGYTLQDDERGETVLSPTVTVSTPGPMAEPTVAPILALDTGAGDLSVDTYYYGITYLDAAGGETPLGPTASVVRAPGYPNASVDISGLDTSMPDEAAAWRLYRMRAGGDFAYLASGTGGTFTDDGSESAICDDHPPTDNFNTTNSINTLSITLPDEADIDPGTEFINVYVSDGGDFIGATFLEQFPVASAGATKEYPGFTLDDRQPPDVSTAVGGAPKIDPDTELEDWFWKRPVANEAALPADPDGTVRLTLDDGTAWKRVAGVWEEWIGGTGGGGGSGTGSVAVTDGVSAIDPADTLFFIPSTDGWVETYEDPAGTAVISGGSLAPAVKQVTGAGVFGVAEDATANTQIDNLGAFTEDYMNAAGGLVTYIEADVESRLRIYMTAADRTADAARAIGVDPTGDHGVLLDYVFGSGGGTMRLVPPVQWNNGDDPVENVMYLALTRLAAGTGAVNVVLHVVPNQVAV